MSIADLPNQIADLVPRNTPSPGRPLESRRPPGVTPIDRARARADRSGVEFSLVLFRPPSEELTLRHLRRLARIVARRARLTDDAAWLGQDWVAALLPDTSTAQAQCFCDSVCRLAGDYMGRPEYAIYTYPSNWPAEAEDDLRRGLVSRSPEALWLCPTSAWKRWMDIAGALLGLLLATPLMLIVALLIKWTSPGPVFFTQRRTGFAGRPFTIYKFRTMVTGAEAKQRELLALNEQDGPAFKIKNDPRITRLGRLLRTTSIDELPQLWNVLRGDMSLVGPRPLPCHESDGCGSWQRRRLDVAPGLTCLWQVRGRSGLRFDEWMRLDLAYMRRRNVWRDLLILLQTIPAVILRRGAH